jgi:hypothetical protein
MRVAKVQETGMDYLGWVAKHCKFAKGPLAQVGGSYPKYDPKQAPSRIEEMQGSQSVYANWVAKNCKFATEKTRKHAPHGKCGKGCGTVPIRDTKDGPVCSKCGSPATKEILPGTLEGVGEKAEGIMGGLAKMIDAINPKI